MPAMEHQGSHSPMFTIVMPVYNHEEYVGEAIQSVRDQTFQDWELIVVDDGSTDRSGEIVDRHAEADGRIRAVHQANAGQGAARNNAIAVARGQWMAYIDSDDKYLPEALQRYFDYIQAHPDAKFIYGYRHRLDGDGTITELPPGKYQDRVTDVKDLFQKTFLSQLCVCYRRELLEKAGAFDPQLWCADDYELNLRIGLHTRFEPIGLPTGLRRRHEANVSVQTGRTRMYEAGALKKWVEKLGGKDLIDPDIVRRRLGKLYYSAGRQYFKSRCFAQAICALKRAHRYRHTFKSVAVLVLSYILLPLGTADGHGIPVVE